MNNLLTHFKRLSTLDKLKVIGLLPLAYLETLLTKFWENTKIVMTVLIALLITVFIAIYVDKTVPVFNGASKTEIQNYVYHNCHEMANNFIVAKDGRIRGYVRADDRNIDRIVAVITKYTFEDGDRLIEWLTDFRNGDYSDAVDFHNYCWKKLDGEIGYAVDIRNRYK